MCNSFNEIKNFLKNYISKSPVFKSWVSKEYENSIISIFLGGSTQKETYLKTTESDIDVMVLYNDFLIKKEIGRFETFYNEVRVEFIPFPISTYSNIELNSIWKRNFFIGTSYINRALLTYDDILYTNKDLDYIIDYMINNPYKNDLLRNGVYYLFGSLFTRSVNLESFTVFLNELLSRTAKYNHTNFHNHLKHDRCEKYICLLFLAASKLHIIDNIDIDVLRQIKNIIIDCARKNVDIPTKLEDFIIKNIKQINRYIIDNPIDVIDIGCKINERLLNHANKNNKE